MNLFEKHLMQTKCIHQNGSTTTTPSTSLIVVSALEQMVVVMLVRESEDVLQVNPTQLHTFQSQGQLEEAG